MMLEILFEDEWLLAVDKPAGVVVHPTYKNAGGTLLDELRVRDPHVTPSIVSRLDKLSSGIVLIAKSAAVHAALQTAWPSARKQYLALVDAVVDEESGEIDLPLGTDPADRRRRIVREDGAPSRTRFERLAADGQRSLLRCEPQSGRRHQIRVHLAARGWPIAGDATYGTAAPGCPRHALHAWRLSFRHPVTQAQVDVSPTRVVDLSTRLGDTWPYRS